MCHYLPLKLTLEGELPNFLSFTFTCHISQWGLTGRTWFTLRMLTVTRSLGNVVLWFYFVSAFLRYRKASIRSGRKEWMPSATWITYLTFSSWLHTVRWQGFMCIVFWRWLDEKIQLRHDLFRKFSFLVMWVIAFLLFS